jgi:integrase/recombinase XerD
MGLVPEDCAGARCDEPEASEARWHGRAAVGSPECIAERWPALASRSIAVRWLALQLDAGRSPRTVQAYARSLVDYFAWCDGAGVEVETADRSAIAGYLRDLRERPGRHGPGVVSLNSGAGLANATLQLRVTVVRLFYAFLVEEQVRERNPVARGYRSADGWAGRRGLVARLDPLPWIPTDVQWRAILDVAAGESLRNRLMLALAYDAALRPRGAVSA